jgi:hypothetical protein
MQSTNQPTDRPKTGYSPTIRALDAQLGVLGVAVASGPSAMTARRSLRSGRPLTRLWQRSMTCLPRCTGSALAW